MIINVPWLWWTVSILFHGNCQRIRCTRFFVHPLCRFISFDTNNLLRRVLIFELVSRNQSVAFTIHVAWTLHDLLCILSLRKLPSNTISYVPIMSFHFPIINNLLQCVFFFQSVQKICQLHPLHTLLEFRMICVVPVDSALYLNALCGVIFPHSDLSLGLDHSHSLRSFN